MKYSYQMLGRPFMIGCQPTGHIDYIEQDKRLDGCYGVVVYDRPLTDKELYSFELKLVANNEKIL